MVSRLADSTSTKLAQHADIPVDWWPWSPEAFNRAGDGWPMACFLTPEAQPFYTGTYYPLVDTGAFAASLDADTAGAESATYRWTGAGSSRRRSFLPGACATCL